MNRPVQSTLSLVNRVVLTVRRSFPMFPGKRKSLVSVGMSQRCQLPTHVHRNKLRGRIASRLVAAETDWIGRNHAIGCHDEHRLIALGSGERRKENCNPILLYRVRPKR